MESPQPNSPTRAINRASTSAQVLGVLALVLGLIGTSPLLFSLLVGRTRFGRGHIIYFLARIIGFLVPAAMYFVIAIFIRKRAGWSAIAGIVVATIHALAAIIVVGFACWAIFTVGSFMIIPLTVGAIIFWIAIWGILNFIRALNCMHEVDDESSPGFSPILPD